MLGPSLHSGEEAVSPGRRDTFTRLLRKLFFPDAGFTAQKFRDHQRFTAIMFFILAAYLTLLWGWDYFTDPVGARVTFYLRLSYLLLLPSALGMWIGKSSHRFLAVTGALSMLLGEMVFVVILDHLRDGMDRGLGGFMYVLVILILVTEGLPLIFGILCTLVAVATPQLMAASGLVPQFPSERYAVLFWPATGLIVLVQIVLALQYIRRSDLERQLKLLSHTDALTGVHNRRYFMPLIEREMERARRLGHDLSLLILDIDHFKQINDSYGHPAGDLILCRLTDLCGKAVREIDVIARVGGEEFSVLLAGATAEQAIEAAERIRRLVEASIVLTRDKEPMSFTVSIGVATLNSPDKTGKDLFERADAALYAAKEAGRNRVVSG